MVIISANLSKENSTYTKDGINVFREYTVKFTGLFDSIYAYSSGALPQYGTQYGTSGVYVNSLATDIADGAQPNPPSGQVGVAIFKVTYAPPTISAFDQSPLDRPAVITWGGSDITEVRKYDINDIAIMNAAYDFYEDLPEFYIRGGECTITRNESANPATVCVTYSNTMNDATWNGVVARNALFGKITANKKIEVVGGANVTYWEVTYPIQFRRDSWNYKTFNYGYGYYNDDDDYVIATDINGNTNPSPVFLDADGKLLDATEPIAWPEDGNGFQVYEDTTWSTLSLPNPFA